MINRYACLHSEANHTIWIKSVVRGIILHLIYGFKKQEMSA